MASKSSRNALKQLLRPEYGSGTFRVQPKRWWKRSDRRSAAFLAKILDASDSEIRETVKDRMRQEAMSALFPE